MKHRVLQAALYAGFLALALGCGGDGGGSDDNDESPGGNNTGGQTRTGTTECGGQTCSAGQYCDNLLCMDGCLSDDNCTSTQVCEKPAGENRGTCQTTQTTPAATKDCPGFVQKCVACGEPESLCEMQCDVINAECASCVVNTSGCTLEACDAVCGN